MSHTSIMGSGGKGSVQFDENIVKRRKKAGIVSAIVGAPNLIISLIAFIGGIAGSILLAYIIIAMVFGDNGGDDWAFFFIILFAILLIIALIGLLFALLILAIFLIGFSGQVIGGILAYRGKRFGLSMTLLIAGTILSFAFGVITVLTGLFASTTIWINVLIVLWGLYSIGSSVTTGICAWMIAGTKITFRKKERKEKTKMKDRSRNTLKKRDR